MKIIYDKADIEKHREYGAKGGKTAALRLTKRQRQERARQASLARWAKTNKEVTK